MTGKESRQKRSTAEWMTFGVACAVLAGVMGAIASLQLEDPPDPPAFSVEQAGARQVGNRFHVRAIVRNEGGETAENVQVVAELEVGSEAPVEAEQVVDFLSGGEEEEVEFVLAEDPTAGTLQIEVRSFKAR